MQIFIMSLIISALSALCGSQGFAASPTGGHDELDYPELQVAPRASERLQTESKRETTSPYLNYIPMMTSSTMTFAAGLAQLSGKDPGKDTSGSSPVVGLVVGGGWLAAEVLMMRGYRPYSTPLVEVNALPKGTLREKLVRERTSEEAIESAARMGRRLTLISVITNVGAGAYMLTKATSGSFSFAADLITMAVAFTPVIFPFRWQTVANDQHDYKKKIFAPVASATFYKEPGTGNLAPGMLLGLAF